MIKTIIGLILVCGLFYLISLSWSKGEKNKSYRGNNSKKSKLSRHALHKRKNTNKNVK